LTAIVVAVLLATIPLAIMEIVRTGELYVFSRRFAPDLLARFHGPGRLRFIFQPTVAIILGARDGVKDARLCRLPFLSALIFPAQRRSELLREALASVRDLVAVAILLDVVSQILILHTVHPAAAVILGPVLIGLPYGFARAIANRIARRRT